MENSPPPRTDSATPLPPATSPWILLVDDEPAILQLIGTVLASQGYPIRVAKNAEAAMAQIDSSPVAPALLICDVLMPGLDGLEMTRRIVSRLPKLKVIFISGHLEDISWWPADLCEYRFVPKHFTNDQLASVVAEVMADRET